MLIFNGGTGGGGLYVLVNRVVVGGQALNKDAKTQALFDNRPTNKLTSMSETKE